MTTDKVYNEVQHIKQSLFALEVQIESGSLQIINPEDDSVMAVVTIAKKSGDYASLSDADISTLALALQLRLAIISDDYAIGNAAAFLDIPIITVGVKGIRKARRSTSYCGACGKAFGWIRSECPVCGNKLRRRYRTVKLL